ncbi:hypothetical protein G7074_18180 [Pedobacter sp. HDW13]|uniref:hypothetical protein n=1 Tax=Pedobacter sp. HDW13 TaxID=2714940 RepID=UPI00140C9353|nr:hypothetical protein [Pedobacter sp. HDW13]QIL41023.1 hypothetical protein G7074_18180 [Pedobacter sp. HDW13]
MIDGLNKALEDLQERFLKIEMNVKKEIGTTGEKIKSDASVNASAIGFFDSYGNWVELSGKVKGNAFEAGNGYRIWVNAGEMAAYIEFGTGEYAKNEVGARPQNWRDLAYEFYVNGKGELPARPYIYPSWVQNTTGLLDRLRTAIKRK